MGLKIDTDIDALAKAIAKPLVGEVHHKIIVRGFRNASDAKHSFMALTEVSNPGCAPSLENEDELWESFAVILAEFGHPVDIHGGFSRTGPGECQFWYVSINHITIASAVLV
jgi:hypothetical protein